VNVSQHVSLHGAQFSENHPIIIVILAGEFVAKRMSTLSSAEDKPRRPQFTDGGEVERDVTGWLMT